MIGALLFYIIYFIVVSMKKVLEKYFYIYFIITS